MQQDMVVNPEQTFYDAIVQHLDTESYDGSNCSLCLIGQVKRAFDITSNLHLALYFGVSFLNVDVIYHYSGYEAYYQDATAALAMARDVLGINQLSE